MSCSPRMRRHWSGASSGSRSRYSPASSCFSASRASGSGAPRRASSDADARQRLRDSRPPRSTASASLTNGSSRGSATRFGRALFGLALVGEIEREHVAVGLEERRLAGRVAHLAVIVERRADRLPTPSSRPCAPGSSAATALRCALTICAAGPSQASHGFRSENAQRCEAQRMELPRQLRGDLVAPATGRTAARRARRRAG